MQGNESFEFRIGGFALRGAVGSPVSVIAQPGMQLSAEQALVLARVLQAVAVPVPSLAQLDAAALAALERLIGGSSGAPVGAQQVRPIVATPVSAPTASVASAQSQSAQASAAEAVVPPLAAAPPAELPGAASVEPIADAAAAPRPAVRRILAFHRNLVPSTREEAARALAALQAEWPVDGEDGEAIKRLVRPVHPDQPAPALPAAVTRRLREPEPTQTGIRRVHEPRVRRPVARNDAHAEELLLGHKAQPVDKRLIYPIGPVEAAALIPTAAKALGKRLVRPSAARVDIARPTQTNLWSPAPAAPAKPAAPPPVSVKVAAPAKPFTAPTTPQLPAPRQSAASAGATSVKSAPAVAAPALPERPAAVAPATADAGRRQMQSIVPSGAKPVPVLRSSAPPAKPKGGIMDRYDEWMREHPGQHSREHLVDVGVSQGWLPKDDAHRVFNVAMHQQRAREMFMIMRDGSAETFMRREEATRPTSSGPGKIIRRSAAEVAARRQEGP